MMKLLLLKKKACAILTLAFTFIISLACAFAFGGVSTAMGATTAEIKAAYESFLLTYSGSAPETDFIKYVESTNGMKYFSQGGYIGAKDKLTDAGVAMVQEVFGIDQSYLLNHGGTIGNANYERWTGSYVATSANNVPAGGESVGEGDFSIIVMGDQQTAVEYHSAMVATSYDWIVSNAQAMNLKMFINVGDIVDDTGFVSWREPSGNPHVYVNFHPGRLGTWQLQQKFAVTQAEKLLNAGIPAAFTMGNHDYADMAESYRIKEPFLEDFSIDKFNTASNGFGGSLYNDIEAAWYEFEANGQDYMVITLGCYPTTEILNWANSVVEAHPDHKVIVSTHAYFDGATYDFREDATVIWDTFVSRHPNIFMLVNGHDCTDDGSIVKKVDYGVNGNAVTQLMINPQVEEFGGAGTIAQLIFRSDGTVDLVYYSPYSHLFNGGKGYFMNENQFSFSLEPEKITIDGNLLGKETVTDKDFYTDGTSASYSYFGHDTALSGSVKPAEGVYAYNNTIFTESGFAAGEAGEAYVVHKLYAGDYNVFCKMAVCVFGEFTGADLGMYQIELSSDGVNYVTGLYCNSETGEFGREYILDRFARGGEYLYVRVSVKNAVVSKLYLKGDSVRTVFTDKTFRLEYDFSNNVLADAYQDWDMKGAYSKYYAVLSGNVLGSGGAGRMSYKSYVTYRFDSGDDKRYFEEFSVDFQFRAQYLLSRSEGYNFSQREGLDYILELSVSIDDGKTFVPVRQYTEEDCGVSASVPSNNYWVNEPVLSDSIIEEKFGGERIKSFILKIDYFGAGPERAHAGLYNLNIAGSLNRKINTDEKEDYSKTYVLNGGYFEKNSVLPKRSGFEFKGWYLNEDFSGSQVNPSDYSNDANYTFYAKWARAYYITYILDGGVNSEKNAGFINDGSLITLLDASKEGKVFMGWYDGNGNRYSTIKGNELSSDLVLYAVWADGSVGSGGCSSNADADLSLVAAVSVLAFVFIALKKTHSKKIGK